MELSGKVYFGKGTFRITAYSEHCQTSMMNCFTKSSYLVHSLTQAQKNKKIYPEKNFLYFEKFLL